MLCSSICRDLDNDMGGLDRGDREHPGLELESVAASADISDTTRNGPHCRSTCAITESLITRVTRPVKRFRALSATGLPSSGAVAISCACAASSAPSMVVGPLALLARSRPESSQRRTVSSETPSSEAA